MSFTIKQLNYNWRPVGPYQNDEGFEFDMALVGSSGVVKISDVTEDLTTSVFEVEYENGNCEHIYNPNQVFFEKEKTNA